MEVTDSISDRLLRLPLYYEMEIDMIHRVAEELEQFYCVKTRSGGESFS